MKVLVFDIDGTLTATNRVDGRCFRASLDALLPEWGGIPFEDFVEFTDAAIIRDLVPSLSQEAFEEVEQRVLEHFLAGLRRAWETDPDGFNPVPGAREVFARAQDAGWVPAIATGGWRPCAELKLEAAGIVRDGVPMTTSTESPRRADIIRLAVQRATDGEEPAEVVYVGDGVWDVRACRELGIGFVGRGGAKGERRLTEHGARAVIRDYLDPERFFGLLADPVALVPA